MSAFQVTKLFAVHQDNPHKLAPSNVGVTLNHAESHSPNFRYEWAQIREMNLTSMGCKVDSWSEDKGVTDAVMTVITAADSMTASFGRWI